VNVLGSLFYGPILGIFLVAFFVKKANGTDVFRGAIAAEAIVVSFWAFDVVSFLWLNVVGAVAVVGYALVSSSQNGESTGETSGR
jgi:solute:Na+ symporter, SSS family